MPQRKFAIGAKQSFSFWHSSYTRNISNARHAPTTNSHALLARRREEFQSLQLKQLRNQASKRKSVTCNDCRKHEKKTDICWLWLFSFLDCRPGICFRFHIFCCFVFVGQQAADVRSQRVHMLPAGASSWSGRSAALTFSLGALGILCVRPPIQ